MAQNSGPIGGTNMTPGALPTEAIECFQAFQALGIDTPQKWKALTADAQYVGQHRDYTGCALRAQNGSLQVVNVAQRTGAGSPGG